VNVFASLCTRGPRRDPGVWLWQAHGQPSKDSEVLARMRFWNWHSVRGKLCWCHGAGDAEELPSRLQSCDLGIADELPSAKSSPMVRGDGDAGPRSECWRNVDRRADRRDHKGIRSRWSRQGVLDPATAFLCA